MLRGHLFQSSDTYSSKNNKFINISDEENDIKGENKNKCYTESDRSPILKGIISNKSVFSGPEVLEIDLTNNCNLQCIGCWCHSTLLGRQKYSGKKKREYLPTEKVLTLINDIKRMGVGTVQLTGAGEPFMHPGIWKILHKIKKSELKINIVTNFTTINESRIKKIIELGIDYLTVSVWAGDAEIYQITHPGVSKKLFSELEHNLSRLTGLRGINKKPKLKIFQVINNKNAHNIQSMIDFAFRVNADDIEFQPVDVIKGLTDSLELSSNESEILFQQFKMIRDFPNFTNEFVCPKHLKSLDNELLERELTEYGRLHHPLPPGFHLAQKGKGLFCPNDYGGLVHQATDGQMAFIFPFELCHICNKYKSCPKNSNGEVQVNVRLINLLGIGSFFRRISCLEEKNRKIDKEIIDNLPCYIGWTYARVRVNGDVIPCCKAVSKPLGNIFSENFKIIWESRKYKKFRTSAKQLKKSDPYFRKINCYDSCDNVGMNLNTHLNVLKYIKNQEC